jgi:hypothetical protein
MDMCITIRTIIFKTKAYIPGGAGMIADSDPEEYRNSQQGKRHVQGHRNGGKRTGARAVPRLIKVNVGRAYGHTLLT